MVSVNVQTEISTNLHKYVLTVNILTDKNAGIYVTL